MRSSTKRSLDNRHLKCAAGLTPMPFHPSWNMRASRYARAGADNSSSGSTTITTLYSTDMTLAEPLRLRPPPKNRRFLNSPPHPEKWGLVEVAARQAFPDHETQRQAQHAQHHRDQPDLHDVREHRPLV